MALSFGVTVPHDPPYDQGEIVTQPGHGRFVARSLGARAAIAS